MDGWTRHLRSAGLILLLVGLLVTALRFPSLPAAPWDFVHGFAFDDDVCQALRESRETARFTCPDSIDETVTAGEVARRYNLELSLVCQANELAPDCGNHRIAPGESLILPLGRRSQDLPRSSPPGAGG